MYYLVAYRVLARGEPDYKEHPRSGTFLKELAVALQGPIKHVELVHVKDLIANALAVTLYDREPKIQNKRTYEDTENVEIEWYKFKLIDHFSDVAIRQAMDDFVYSKEYVIDPTMLLNVSIPGFLKGRDRLLGKIYFGKTVDDEGNDLFRKDPDKKGTYCSHMTATVLNDSIFEDNPIDPDITTTDLLAELLSRNVLEKSPPPKLCYQYDPSKEVKPDLIVQRTITAPIKGDYIDDVT